MLHTFDQISFGGVSNSGDASLVVSFTTTSALCGVGADGAHIPTTTTLLELPPKVDRLLQQLELPFLSTDSSSAAGGSHVRLLSLPLGTESTNTTPTSATTAVPPGTAPTTMQPLTKKPLLVSISDTSSSRNEDDHGESEARTGSNNNNTQYYQLSDSTVGVLFGDLLNNASSGSGRTTDDHRAVVVVGNDGTSSSTITMQGSEDQDEVEMKKAEEAAIPSKISSLSIPSEGNVTFSPNLYQNVVSLITTAAVATSSVMVDDSAITTTASPPPPAPSRISLLKKYHPTELIAPTTPATNPPPPSPASTLSKPTHNETITIGSSGSKPTVLIGAGKKRQIPDFTVLEDSCGWLVVDDDAAAQLHNLTHPIIEVQNPTSQPATMPPKRPTTLTFPLRPHHKVLPLPPSPNASMSITDDCVVQMNRNHPKMTLVLGLEGLMVHVLKDERHGTPHAVVTMKKSGQTTAIMNVYYRPHIAQFITTVAELYDIAIFSSGEQDCVDALLDVMDPSGQVFPKSRRYYRQHCTKVVSLPSPDVASRSEDGANLPLSKFLAKDLRVVGRPLNEVVMVDDTASSGFLQPENLLLIPSWKCNPTDTAMLKLTDDLVHIAHHA